MDEFATQLVQKVGLDEDNARKVVEFVKEHWDEIPGWIGSSGVGAALADKLPGGLGDMFGGK